jgi:hypothetical protein
MEAYFSNFIEGTEFLIGEAVEIVFEGKMPEDRPQDGHDVLRVYQQLVDLGGRSASMIDADTFIDEIQERHRRLMDARPSVKPGAFKTKSNQAGDTTFVDPSLVRGTLREGIMLLRSLSDPFSRGLFVHFLLSDVHPFNDGNGRLSRIMMTKELVSAGLSRIVVPTVYRSDYLDALRALSRRGEPLIFVRSLEFCQRVSAACSAASLDGAIDAWAPSVKMAGTPASRCPIRRSRSKRGAAFQRRRTTGRRSIPVATSPSLSVNSAGRFAHGHPQRRIDELQPWNLRRQPARLPT